MRRHAYAAASIAAVIAMWAAIAQLKVVDPMLLPGPVTVLAETYVLFASGIIFPDIAATLLRTLGAFGIAAAFAFPFGLALGKAEKEYRSVEFLVDFFRSTPATALFPLFMLFFGVADWSKIAAAAFGAFFLIFFNTAYGVINSRKWRLTSVKMMGASRWQAFKWIVFWESLPQAFVGFRSAISLGLVIVVVTEMFIGTTAGLGRRIVDSQLVYNIPQMYATITVVGILGYLLNFVLRAFEQRYVHWSAK